MKISERVLCAAEFVYNRFPHLRKALRPVYRVFFKNQYNKKKSDNFRHLVYDVMQKFDNCLDSCGVNYSLAFGSMLGAVREGGIIGHDDDVDTFVWFEDNNYVKIRQALEKSGFILYRAMVVEDGILGREETYIYNTIPIDIFYIYQCDDNTPYTCGFKPLKGFTTLLLSMEATGRIQARKGEYPFVKKYIKVPFGNVKLPIMENYDEILKVSYGSNYMIPDPSWVPQGEEVNWDGVKAKLIYYNGKEL